MSKPSRKRRNPLRQTGGQRHSRLVPHSDAWYAALVQIDPAQAFMTQAVVDHAGRPDVCSVCGDKPARIYDLTADPSLPIRLCDRCLVFQRELGARLQKRPAVGREMS